MTLGIVFVVAGLFKGRSPHLGASVYEGAPTPVTAFLSVSSKTAGFVALLALFLLVL